MGVPYILLIASFLKEEDFIIKEAVVEEVAHYVKKKKSKSPFGCTKQQITALVFY